MQIQSGNARNWNFYLVMIKWNSPCKYAQVGSKYYWVILNELSFHLTCMGNNSFWWWILHMALPSVHNTKAPWQPGLLFHSNWGATSWLRCSNWMHSNECWRLHYIKTTPSPRKLPMGRDWFIHLRTTYNHQTSIQ
jgi:hypothetical protein